MNKTLWTLAGGAPITNDDWQYDQDAVRQAFKGIVSTLGGNALLGGCIPTPVSGGHTFTEGYVAINGEIYYVPAVTLPISFDEDNNHFVIEVTPVSGGERVFENVLAPVNVFQQRIARLVHNFSPPPNSLDWLTAFNNKLSEVAYNAVMAKTIIPNKGIFLKALPSNLSVLSGQLSFDSANGNFAVVNINNTTLQQINLDFSSIGHPFVFAVKLSGTGYLKVEHGSISCPNQRNHFFKSDSVVWFMSDGGFPDKIHLISEGDADSGWHTVGTISEPAFESYVNTFAAQPLSFKKVDDDLILSGACAVSSTSFGGNIFSLPSGYYPSKYKYIKVLVITSGNISSYTAAVASSGLVTLLFAGTLNVSDAIFFTDIRVALT